MSGYQTHREGEGTNGQWAPTEDEIKAIQTLAAAGLNEEQTADYLKISRSTFQMAMNKNPMMRQAVLYGRSNALATVAKTAYDMAKRGDNPSMTQFYLRCRGGGAWKMIQVIEHEGLKDSEEKKVSDLLQEFKALLGAVKSEQA